MSLVGIISALIADGSDFRYSGSHLDLHANGYEQFYTQKYKHPIHVTHKKQLVENKQMHPSQCVHNNHGCER